MFEPEIQREKRNSCFVYIRDEEYGFVGFDEILIKGGKSVPVMLVCKIRRPSSDIERVNGNEQNR